MQSIAVIGAGMAGLTLARRLQNVAAVQVFEKSRGLGGRMAVRRAGSYEFDHGAQFFTARSKQFQALLKDSIAEQWVQAWTPRVLTLGPENKPYKRDWFEPHYVAVPGMNALCKSLGQGLSIQLETRIGTLEASERGWQLIDSAGHSLGEFDWVIAALPAPQTVALLPDRFAHRSGLNEVDYSPCYSLMLGFDSAPKLNFEAAVVRDSELAWLAVNPGKPGRSATPSMVVHSDNDWARSQLESTSEDVREKMLRALATLLGDSLPRVSHSAIHLWRYARAEKFIEASFLVDAANRLAVCGDWCGGNRVEHAFLSGLHLGEHLEKLLDEKP